MTDYAVVILSDMAQNHDKQKGEVLSATTIAQSTKLPEPTVSKILKLLAKKDLVDSLRGINGGYAMSKRPEEVNMVHIIQATEGDIELTACVDTGSQCCDRANDCSIKGKWNPVNLAMRMALEDVSLKQMMGER